MQYSVSCTMHNHQHYIQWANDDVAAMRDKTMPGGNGRALRGVIRCTAQTERAASMGARKGWAPGKNNKHRDDNIPCITHTGNYIIICIIWRSINPLILLRNSTYKRDISLQSDELRHRENKRLGTSDVEA